LTSDELLPAPADETADADITRPGRRLVALVLKIAVSGGLLAVLLSRTDVSRIWLHLKSASISWLAIALLLNLVVMVTAAWRWGLLLAAQHITVPFRTLLSSYLVASYFNNFLPSNIGGDVIRIRDTSAAAGSKTLATTVVLADRAIGLLGLGLIAAIGATAGSGLTGQAQVPVSAPLLWAGLGLTMALSVPAVLAPAGITRVLQPLRIFHPEWVDRRLERIATALGKFRERPLSLLGCFTGAIVVQGLLVFFYAAIAHSMAIPVPLPHLAVLVPVSFIVQMLPVSVNGFGVREATFSFYFAGLGLPLESAIVLSLVGAGLTMLFSLTGAVAYVTRRR
jgi:glycosyltransferase 2 family protein